MLTNKADLTFSVALNSSFIGGVIRPQQQQYCGKKREGHFSGMSVKQSLFRFSNKQPQFKLYWLLVSNSGNIMARRGVSAKTNNWENEFSFILRQAEHCLVLGDAFSPKRGDYNLSVKSFLLEPLEAFPSL